MGGGLCFSFMRRLLIKKDTRPHNGYIKIIKYYFEGLIW